MEETLLFLTMNFFISFKNCILKEEDSDSKLDVKIVYFDRIETGKKGTLLFLFYYYSILSSIIDTSKKVYFKAEISDSKDQKYEVDWVPWKNSINLLIFCTYDESIPAGNYYIEFNNTFIYSKYEIKLTSNKKFNISKLYLDYPDIYSGKQIINTSDSKEIYELKFKINSYHQERLFMDLDSLIPINCNKNNNELICPIKKNRLELCMKPIRNSRHYLTSLNIKSYLF